MNALIEPFFYCLFASVIWAPLVFIGAHRLSAKDHGPTGALGSLSGKVWPAALIFAALPVIMAPIAATFGLSLRAPAPLPPMAELAAPALQTAEIAAPLTAPAATTVSLADILRMAAVLYFYGFLMLMALAVVRHIWFAYRLNYAIAIDEPALEARLEEWRRRIGVKQKPRYVFSHIVSSVCVYGFFRPVIVMPYNLLERVSIEDAALMGAHEMAHVKRGDVALFALCSAVKAVFWFNPFMHRICARANLAAEQGADALVLARGVDRRQYAHCFVKGLRLAAGAPQNRFTGELIPSFTPFDKRSRRARLDAILSGANETPLLSLPAKLSLGAGAVLAAGLAFAQAAFAVSPPPAVQALPVAPVEGEVGFAFGEKSKLLGPDRPSHEGIDIRAPRGEPVLAAGDGKVIDATERYQGSTAWGNVVVIDHGHGLVTRYAHLDSFAVRKGDRVRAGDVIGAVGSTGKATGPHLHFEVIENGAPIDPSPVLALAPAAPIKAAPKIKSAHNVPIAPMPEAAAPAPKAAIDIDAEVNAKLNEKKSRKLDERLEKLEGKLKERFHNFDAFSDLDDVVIRFNDVELEGFEDAEAFSELLDGREFHFDGFSNFEFFQPEGWRFSFNSELSAKEREEIKRAQEQARRNAAEAMKRAKKEMARAKREAERARREAFASLDEDDRERALEQAERERERAFERMQRDAERELERAQRQFERAQEQAEREHERALEQAEWAREHAREQAERAKEHAFSEAEALEHQERAILDAQEHLERQLEEIEERKRELMQREREERTR